MPPGLGEILAESGDLTLRRLRRASDWRRVHGGTIDRALLATGAVSEETLLDALARLTGLPSVSRERLAAASREAVEIPAARGPPPAPRPARSTGVATSFTWPSSTRATRSSRPASSRRPAATSASTSRPTRSSTTFSGAWETARAERRPERASSGSPRRRPPPRLPLRQVGPASDRLRRPAPDPTRSPGSPARSSSTRSTRGLRPSRSAPKGKGPVLRTFSGGLAQSSRPLPRPVLEPLFAWFLARSRPSGPFDDGGLVLERAGRRVRVERDGRRRRHGLARPRARDRRAPSRPRRDRDLPPRRRGGGRLLPLLRRASLSPPPRQPQNR